MDYKHIADLENGLFVGSWLATKMDILNNFEIKHVISIGADPAESISDNCVTYRMYMIDDNIQSASNLLAIMDSILQEIDLNLKTGNVLVHCSSGKSRSITIVIAYIMSRRNMSLKSAFEFVREKRPIINPNIGFMQMLETL